MFTGRGGLVGVAGQLVVLNRIVDWCLLVSILLTLSWNLSSELL